MEKKIFAVWEPAREAPSAAAKVEAETPGQAAFFAANERKIGHRSALFVAYDGKDAFAIQIEPHTTYQVASIRPAVEVANGHETA